MKGSRVLGLRIWGFKLDLQGFGFCMLFSCILTTSHSPVPHSAMCENFHI